MFKLKLKQVRKYEYECELTKMLDNSAGFEILRYGHYLMYDEWCKKEKCFPLRVPGRTIGGVWVDENLIITKIQIIEPSCQSGYPENINDSIQKYVGYKIEF